MEDTELEEVFSVEYLIKKLESKYRLNKISRQLFELAVGDLEETVRNLNESKSSLTSLVIEDGNDGSLLIAGRNYERYYTKDALKYDKWLKEFRRHRDNDAPAFITYYDTGEILSEEYFRSDTRYRADSKPSLIFYHQNGNKHIEQWYDDKGKLGSELNEPAVIKYDNSGEVTHMAHYSHGALIKQEEFKKRAVHNG